jgi:hypothetical protein
MASIIEILVGMGGREWRGGANHRVYLPRAAASRLMGLSCTRYGSGNISGARLGGDRISNGEARQIELLLDGAYYDVVAGKVQGCRKNATLTEAVRAIQTDAAIAEGAES